MRRPILAWLTILMLGLVAWTPSALATTKPNMAAYAFTVQDEVNMQNLTCDDIQSFRQKPVEALMVTVAEEILNEPQHFKDTSQTLFGDQLTRLILTASNNPPPIDAPGGPCTRIAPYTYPDPMACRLDPAAVLRDLSMGGISIAPVIHPGELTLLGMFDHAAKLKNCGTI